RHPSRTSTLSVGSLSPADARPTGRLARPHGRRAARDTRRAAATATAVATAPAAVVDTIAALARCSPQPARTAATRLASRSGPRAASPSIVRTASARCGAESQELLSAREPIPGLAEPEPAPGPGL